VQQRAVLVKYLRGVAVLGKGAKGTSKPTQTGVGKPSYRAFVAAEMRGNGGDLKAAAAKWKS
jgi:hypothetical protein